MRHLLRRHRHTVLILTALYTQRLSTFPPPLPVSLAREAIARGLPAQHQHLAALAGMSHKHLWTLVKRGDAPQGEPGPDDGRRRVYDPEACREWFAGRGVPGVT